ncbi:G-protein coupled receptor 52-like [Glandiceps talaboti]
MAAFFTELFSSVSVWSLAMIGVDRYLAIAKPLTYKKIMPPERARVVIVTMWVLLSLMCLLPAIGVVNVMYYADLYVCNVAWEEELFYSAGVFIAVILPSFTAIIYCYYHIFRIAHRTARQIATENDRLQTTQRSILKRRRGAMMSLLIVASFCVSWTPWLVLQIQESVTFAQTQNTSEINEHPHLPEIHFVSMWIAFSNSFLNCIIYYLANRSFRLGAKRVLRAIFCKKVNADVTSEDNINIWSVAVTMRRCES